MSQESLLDTVELLDVPGNGPVYYSADASDTVNLGVNNNLPYTINNGLERQKAICSPKVYTLGAASLAAVGGILFGYDVGIISGALLQLRVEFCLTCLQRELVVSFMLIGAVIGSLTGGFIIDYYGRRFTIIINSGIFVIGAIMLALSPSYGVLIVARLMVGYAVALSAIAECVYVSEIAPAKRRGLLVSLNELGITLGFLLAYLINYLFIHVPHGWRYMFGLSAIPAFLQGIGTIFLPRSPRYLMIKKKEQQALSVLTKLREGSPASIQHEVTAIRLSIDSEQNHNFFDLFTNKDNMRGRLIIGAGLVFFQQFTGQPNVLYYAPTIFESIGFTSDTGATLATIGLGVVKVICTIAAVLFVDKIGRRKLLLIGSAMMTISILLLGVCQPHLTGHQTVTRPCNDHPCIKYTNIGFDNTSSSLNFSNNTGDFRNISHITDVTTIKSSLPTISGARKWLSLVALMLFVAAFAIGFGPVTWLVLSEIFPSSIKGRAVSMTTVVNWATNLVVSLTFLQIMNAIGVSWTFITYSFICLVSIIFVFTVVPETKNKTLEQISADLKTRSHIQRISAHCKSLSCCNPRSAFRLRISGDYQNVQVF